MRLMNDLHSEQAKKRRKNQPNKKKKQQVGIGIFLFPLLQKNIYQGSDFPQNTLENK